MGSMSTCWHHHYFYLILQIYLFIGYTPKNLSFCASSGEMGNYTTLKGAFRGERFGVFAFQRTLDKVAHLVCSILCFVVFAIEIELNGDHRLWICAINDAPKGVVGGSVGKFKSVFVVKSARCAIWTIKSWSGVSHVTTIRYSYSIGSSLSHAVKKRIPLNSNRKCKKISSFHYLD